MYWRCALSLSLSLVPLAGRMSRVHVVLSVATHHLVGHACDRGNARIVHNTEVRIRAFAYRLGQSEYTFSILAEFITL
jgi:hypothetical protein